MTSKRSLAVFLSKLKIFEKPKVKLEQYETDSEIAATVLWDAYMNGDIEDKIVADLGCGTGILGIGAMMLGAEKVFFLDKDKEALTILKENIEENHLDDMDYEILNIDIEFFEKTADTIIQNPPFGIQRKNADRIFLEKALDNAKSVYSFHKTETRDFIKRNAEKRGFLLSNEFEFKFPLKKTQTFHTKQREFISASCFELRKR